MREWLVNQAAGGYLDYDAASGRYSLPPEHAVALTDESHPFFLAGCYQASLALVKSEHKIGEAFGTGQGLAWGEHDAELFPGAERGLEARLPGEPWCPPGSRTGGGGGQAPGGGQGRDVGCGHGASTLILAQAYPNSQVIGCDNHAPSIEHARRAAVEAGLAGRVTFAVADATSIPGERYDLVAFFDSFHDLGDPLGAARRVRSSLAPDGTLMLVEPMAGQRVEENLNPVGRVFSGFSVLCCTPNAIAPCGCDEALGTIASDDDLREVVSRAGFTRFRRAAEAPFNRIFEVRP